MADNQSKKIDMLVVYGILLVLFLSLTVTSFLYVNKLKLYDEEYLDAAYNLAVVSQSAITLSSEAVKGNESSAKKLSDMGQTLQAYAVKIARGNPATDLPPFGENLRDLATRISSKVKNISTGLKEVRKNYKTNVVSAERAVKVITNDGKAILPDLDELSRAVTTEKTHPFFIVDRVNHTMTTVLGLGTLLFLILLGDHIIRQTRSEQKQAKKNFEDSQNAILNLLDDISSLADGDLTKEVRVSEDITGAIADSINYTVEELRNLVSTIQTSAKQVNDTSARTQVLANSLAETNDSNEKLISTSAGAVSGVAEEVKKMSDSARGAATMANESSLTAKEGAQTVRDSIRSMNNVREQIQETSKRIKRLGESSQEIGDILEIITDIADQTNLLALNAAMQAATAGEAGRGFAVVADEVQRLAERSSKAALQIDTLIKTIQTDTSEAIHSMESSTSEVVTGADNIEKAGDSLHKIETTSGELAAVITQLSSQAQRQTVKTDEINKIMDKVHETTDKTTKETREAVTLITQLAGLSVTLEESVAGFKLAE
ncbi:MAG: hypothetical protein A6F71_03325 [Cycloclasticus sp. symbiont of Poecilosclerida sp. M]|nr:MAG: hypothetical protein A6F71_03325 [Cycloclasticus sp. symbiont of Poecilosclerida sp. M]